MSGTTIIAQFSMPLNERGICLEQIIERGHTLDRQMKEVFIS